jgi:VanZ family protein
MATKGNIPCNLGTFRPRSGSKLRMGPSFIARLAATVTAAYTAVLVFATHYPKPQELLGANAPSDKTLHVMAYAVLALLVGLTLVAAGRWTRPAIARAAAGMAIFGALDEITQPLPWFRRAADPLDWAFDLGGIAIGLAAIAVAVAIWRSVRGRQ